MSPKDEARFRIKVWIDEEGKLFMIPLVFANLDDGTVSGVAVSDEGNVRLLMTIEQYNALPYHSFESKGVAEKKDQPPFLGSRNLIHESKAN